jgi:hypothetical protein
MEQLIFDGAVWSSPEDGLMYIKPDGDGWYGHCDNFDFSAKNEDEAIKKLTEWDFKYIGAE